MSLFTSNFTINLYNDLKTEHTGSSWQSVAPFSLGSQIINMRERATPISSSIGQQSKIDVNYENIKMQKILNAKIEEKFATGSI